MAVTEPADENMMAAIAYLGWWVTGVALLLLKKDNTYIRFHAMQATLLFVPLTAILVVFPPLPVIGLLVQFFGTPIAFVLWVVLMWKAFNGERYKLPYVGDYAEKLASKI